jgi:thiamine-monophosphate kinase
MKEQDLIKIIKAQTNSTYIGDDCAYLKQFGIVVSQDNFVENIHFKREYMTPFQIGYKATVVNISDILASGGKPEYISIGLSIPNLGNDFVEEFYKGVQAASGDVQVIGGDITGGEQIFVSITAIGSTRGRKISSRKNTKSGYVIIAGQGENWGESSKGLNDLLNGHMNTKFAKIHIEPKLDWNFSKNIATKIKEDYAMMDTSDGLADALFQIAQASNITIKTNYIEGMFGAEDYRLVAALPKNFLPELTDYETIGEACDYQGAPLIIDGKKYLHYDELNLYNHFGA